MPFPALRRGLAAAFTASFVAVTLVVAAPAAAETEPPGSSTPARDDARVSLSSSETLTAAAAGVVTGRLLFSTDDNPTVRPVRDGEVVAYRFDSVSGDYVEEALGADTFDGDGDWMIDGLPAGTYRFAYVQFGDPLASRLWHGGGRSINEAVDVVLTEGVGEDLGTVIMPVRSIESSRIAGADRFETSTALSRAQFSDGANVPVVIVNGLGFADALSAGPLAAKVGAAMLMVTPTSIPPATLAELERLDPISFVIVGGEGVVSASVEAQLEPFASTDGDKVIRIAGADRYATSRAVLEVGFGGLETDVIMMATGRDYPDALAASAAAGFAGGAVLLVDGLASGLDAPSSDLVETVGAPVYIVGGSGVVSNGVQQSVTDLGLFVDRLGGESRFLTSVEVAIRFFFYADTAFMANAFGFADALAAGPYAAAVGGPIYLTSGACVTQPVWLDMIELGANRVISVGGTGVLSSQVQNLVSCDGDTVDLVVP